MASKFIHEAKRGAGSGSIDLPLAIVAGLSVGFVAFVMPGDILARLVALSGLPEVLPAARPPLGNKAHAAFAVAAASATIAAVYFLLRLLGGKSPEPRERLWPEVDTEREPEAPRLRRSDVHPDAPARRPILAARELGEPTPSPTFSPQTAPAEPEAEVAPADEEPLELGGPGIERLETEPVFAVEPVPEEPVDDVPVASDPAPPAVEPAPAGDASISELMARLERGLARRTGLKSRSAAPVEPGSPPPAPAAEEWGDDRLRSAIENLQKMAARAG